MPGAGPPPGRHGGPLRAVFRDLTEEQKEKFHSIMEANHDKSKAEAKKAVEEFVGTLDEKLQQKVKEQRAKCEAHKKEDAEKVQKLSEAAQKLFAEVKVSVGDGEGVQSRKEVRDKTMATLKNNSTLFSNPHKHTLHVSGGARGRVADL